MKVMRKGERGFSLIELVIVIGLTGVICAGITGAILGVFNADARTRDSMTAVYQVRHAGKLVSEDVLEAQKVTPGPSLGFPLSLSWTEVDGEPTYEVVYRLAGPVGEPQILWRDYYVDREANPDPVSITKVAEHIDPETSFAPVGGGAYSFTVTATVGGQSETRILQLRPRPTQQ